ncbi:MAG: ABC transporter permease [Rhizomicrobium sp.]
MRRAFLIARQEFIKYVTRRGFFISILMFPLWIVVVTMVPQWTGGGSDSPVIFTVVDEAGGAWRAAILDAVERDNADRELDALSHYAGGFADAARLPPAVAALLAHPDDAAARAAFARLGGRARVLAALRPALKTGAPPFREPTPRFVFAEPPADLARAPGPKTIAAALQRQTAPFDIDAVVVVPRDYGPAATAQFWSQSPRGSLRDFVAGALTDALRLGALRKYAPQIGDPALLTPTAALESRNPAHADGSSSAFDQGVPIALAIILFVVSVMNSSVLLQGVVEEKSTRMIEVLLSCATAREITTGKLVGVIAVAITTLLIWGLALIALMALASHETAGLVLAALRAVATIQTVPLLLVFFLCGLLIYGSLFLAIGSMANSLADAQSLLGPSMLILMLPNLMIAGVMRDPNGPLATGLSWVPIYTPFFMMLRIASHPPVWQLWGTTILALVTTVLMIIWTGRIFARNVLTTERPPALGALIGRMFGRGR